MSDKQRFTRGFPCPICSGYDGLKRGTGQRSFGFISEDGKYAHCTREEYAGKLSVNDGSQAYVHWLVGGCRCGESHGGEHDASTRRNSFPRNSSSILATYRYVDADGRCLFEVVRFEPKGFAQRRPCPSCGGPRELGGGGGSPACNEAADHGSTRSRCKDGWIWNLDGVTRVLYRLPEVRNAVAAGDTIYIAEGEKDAEALWKAGGVATCGAGGAGKWRAEYAEDLRDAPVVIWAHSDRAGYRHAQQVNQSLSSITSSVRVVEAAEGNDAADHLAAGHSIEEANPLDVQQAMAGSAVSQDSSAEASSDTKRRSMAARILEHSADLLLFRTPQGEAFARVPAEHGLETWPVRSRPFRELLSQRFYEREQGAVPRAQSLHDAIAILEHRARSEKREHHAWLRVGRAEGCLALDLCNPAWECVEITAHGWEVRSSRDANVWFRRAPNMHALPRPTRGGSIDELRPLVNVASEADFRLMVAFVLGMLRPDGSFPVLALHGEQASAKSTTAAILRSIVDPHEAAIRADPRDSRDLAVAARNSWALAFDNLSSLPPWMSDALCRLSTGGAFATRTLYTDDEEVLFSARRPVILNGINELANRGDLLSRTMVLTLPRVQNPVPEQILWKQFDEARPRILGALLDAVSSALARLPGLELRRYPRLADWARFVVAAEPALGWEDGSFLCALEANGAAANVTALESSPVGLEVLNLVKSMTGRWSGTATELLARLEKNAPEKILKLRRWPRDAAQLSRALRRLQPHLRTTGVEVTFGQREGGTGRRLIQINTERDPAENLSLVALVSRPAENPPNPPGSSDASSDSLEPL